MKSLQEIKYQYPGMTAYHTKIADKNSTWVQANSFLSLVKKSLRSYNIFHSFTLFCQMMSYLFIFTTMYLLSLRIIISTNSWTYETDLYTKTLHVLIRNYLGQNKSLPNLSVYNVQAYNKWLTISDLFNTYLP